MFQSIHWIHYLAMARCWTFHLEQSERLVGRVPWTIVVILSVAQPLQPSYVRRYSECCWSSDLVQLFSVRPFSFSLDFDFFRSSQAFVWKNIFFGLRSFDVIQINESYLFESFLTSSSDESSVSSLSDDVISGFSYFSSRSSRKDLSRVTFRCLRWLDLSASWKNSFSCKFARL